MYKLLIEVQAHKNATHTSPSSSQQRKNFLFVFAFPYECIETIYHLYR